MPPSSSLGESMTPSSAACRSPRPCLLLQPSTNLPRSLVLGSLPLEAPSLLCLRRGPAAAPPRLQLLQLRANPPGSAGREGGREVGREGGREGGVCVRVLTLLAGGAAEGWPAAAVSGVSSRLEG